MARTWLQINVTKSGNDDRPTVSASLGPTWGLHEDDVNLALGEPRQGCIGRRQRLPLTTREATPCAWTSIAAPLSKGWKGPPGVYDKTSRGGGSGTAEMYEGRRSLGS